MACPVVDFGIPSSGAQEISVNSSREVFRCGTNCVKIFITNVSLEKNCVVSVCGSISDATETGRGESRYCLQSFDFSWRDNTVANYVAKNNVNSGIANGTVITTVQSCEGDDGIIYTHTEGQITFRALASIENVNESFAETLKDAVINKYPSIATNTSYRTATNQLSANAILQDVSNQVGVTEFQSLSGTYIIFGTRNKNVNDPEQTYRMNFNYDNGRGEERCGLIAYDRETTPRPVASVIQTLLTQSGDACSDTGKG